MYIYNVLKDENALKILYEENKKLSQFNNCY